MSVRYFSDIYCTGNSIKEVVGFDINPKIYKVLTFRHKGLRYTHNKCRKVLWI